MNINCKIEQKITQVARSKFILRSEIAFKSSRWGNRHYVWRKNWWKVNPQIWRNLKCKNDNRNGERIMAKKQILSLRKSQKFAKMLAILQLYHAKNHYNRWIGMAFITMTIKATDISLFMAKIWVIHKDSQLRIRQKSQK